jgi:hypothetical protein
MSCPESLSEFKFSVFFPCREDPARLADEMYICIPMQKLSLPIVLAFFSDPEV